MNMREQKGKDIAAHLKLERKGNLWIAPSQTGKGKYTVALRSRIVHVLISSYAV